MAADSLWDGPSAAETQIVLGIEWSSIVLAWIALLALLAGAAVVAFRLRRPGGYWMLTGIATFLAGFAYTFFGPPATIYDPSLAGKAFYFLGPVVPFFLFSIGFFRLAWSLHRERAAASSQ